MTESMVDIWTVIPSISMQPGGFGALHHGQLLQHSHCYTSEESSAEMGMSKAHVHALYLKA